MNSTGAYRFIAAYAKSWFAAFLLTAASSYMLVLGAECDVGLSPQQKTARFTQLDSQAETAMREHRSPEAVRFYEEAVCLVPDSARGYYGLGLAQAASGDFLRARESFRTADRLQPTSRMPLTMQVRVNFSLGDIETLKSSLREAAERFPHDAQLHASLARFLAERNLFMLAVAEALRSQQDSNDSNSQVQLAVFENTVGAYDDALRNALAVEQNHDGPLETRGAAAGIAGLSYESLHQPDQAVRYLSESIQLNPAQENSYLALADLYDQQQKYVDAVDILQQARSRGLESKALLLALGGGLVRAERYKEGTQILREILRAAPDTPEAYISLADAARKTGNADGEANALRGLKRYQPEYPMIDILIARALLNYANPSYQDVLNELSTAATKTPDDPEIYFLRGKVYLAQSRYEQAITALQRSIELRPTEPGPYYQLARIYQKLGKSELAREQFERVKYLESASAK